MSKVKFFSQNDFDFHSTCVVDQFNTFKVLGYVTEDVNVTTTKDSSSLYMINQPTEYIVEMSYSNERPLTGRVHRDSLIGVLAGGSKVTSELWDGQLKLAINPANYVWK